MTELEIRQAKELLKLETEYGELQSQLKTINDNIWRNQQSIKDLKNSPEHYFEIQERLKAMFPDEN